MTSDSEEEIMPRGSSTRGADPLQERIDNLCAVIGKDYHENNHVSNEKMTTKSECYYSQKSMTYIFGVKTGKKKVFSTDIELGHHVLKNQLIGSADWNNMVFDLVRQLADLGYDPASRTLHRLPDLSVVVKEDNEEEKEEAAKIGKSYLGMSYHDI